MLLFLLFLLLLLLTLLTLHSVAKFNGHATARKKEKKETKKNEVRQEQFEVFFCMARPLIFAAGRACGATQGRERGAVVAKSMLLILL